MLSNFITLFFLQIFFISVTSHIIILGSFFISIFSRSILLYCFVMVLFLFKVNKVNTCNCRIAPFTAVYMYFLEELFRKIPPNLQIENV